MSTTSASTIAPAAEFTSVEVDLLMSWGRASRLEVAVEALGSDYAGEVTYIGQGFGAVSWIIHRTHGQLWLSLVGDWAGRRCTGWTVAVGSVEQATARIAGMLATGWR